LRFGRRSGARCRICAGCRARAVGSLVIGDRRAAVRTNGRCGTARGGAERGRREVGAGQSFAAGPLSPAATDSA